MPYTKDFRGSDANTNGWEFSGESERNEYRGCRLFYIYFGTKKQASAFSPIFRFPGPQNILYKAIFYASSSVTNTKTEYGYTGITTGKTVVKSNTITLKEDTNRNFISYSCTEQPLEASGEMVDQQRISVSCEPGNWSRPAQEHNIHLAYFSVLYK